MPSPAVSDPSCTDVLSEEESKPQRRKRERGRRPLGSENVAPEATAECCAQTKAHSNDVAHVFQEAQVHGRRYHLSSYLQADDAQSDVMMYVQPHNL